MNEYQNKQRPRVVWKNGKCVSCGENRKSTPQNRPRAEYNSRVSARAEYRLRVRASERASVKADRANSAEENTLSCFLSGFGKTRRGIVAVILVMLVALIAVSAVAFGTEEKANPDIKVNSTARFNLASNEVVTEDGPEGTVKSFHGRGHAVCIDPGHGFDDEGTSNPELGVYEKDVVLNVGLALKDKLESVGIKVYMTHDTNEPPPESSSPYLFGMKKRNGLANSLSDVALYISIHCDAYYEDSTVTGVRIYHMKDEAESESVANAISEAYVELQGGKAPLINAMSGMNSYQVIRESTMPSVLVETGFVSNPDEAKAMLTDEWVDATAGALADGIISSFEDGIIGE